MKRIAINLEVIVEDEQHPATVGRLTLEALMYAVRRDGPELPYNLNTSILTWKVIEDEAAKDQANPG